MDRHKKGRILLYVFQWRQLSVRYQRERFLGNYHRAAQTVEGTKNKDLYSKELRDTNAVLKNTCSERMLCGKVPKGCDAAYVKLEENKIYWVKGEETGSTRYLVRCV